MAKNKITSRLPAKWPGAKGLLAQGNLKVTRRGRLRAKVLIFRTPQDMRRFWRKRLGNDLGPRCLGAVNALRTYVYEVPAKQKVKAGKHEDATTLKRFEVDARFFCVIGLCREHLTMRIISHECVHGGYAYARRAQRAPWQAEAKHFDEEAIAYPAGELARAICVFLEREGFYGT